MSGLDAKEWLWTLISKVIFKSQIPKYSSSCYFEGSGHRKMALDSCFEGLDAEDQFQTLNFAKVSGLGSLEWYQLDGSWISVERIFKWIGLQLSECFLNRTSKIRDFLELQDIFKYFNFNKVLLTNKIFSFIVDLQLLGWDLDRTSKVFFEIL
uniref:Uncharacterized protein n=1 Tax=Rhizophagus irregularis (strain DAOM 181602 / DAOM 197198 / MUCL 43194) TaxID=747089 RepID=U9SZ60_RHIID